MLVPSILVNCALGALVGMFFVFYYVRGEAKGSLKLAIECLIGVAGNAGTFFVIDKLVPIEDNAIRLIGLACCFSSFVVTVCIALFVFAKILKGRDKNDVIRLRDIFLGQYAFIEKYYEHRSQEIDQKLKIDELEKREKAITQQEQDIASKQTYIAEEMARLEDLGKKRLRMKLPENRNITLNQEYITTMPSYIENIFSCIHEINNLTDEFLKKPIESIDESSLKAYLLSIATHVSVDLLGTQQHDGRVHFRIYDIERKGYKKYVAVMGGTIETKEMTFIPYDTTNMIAKSYECRRALIKSLNSSHHYEGKNHRLWKEYLTYTFTDLLYEDKPFLSFGISIKSIERFKKHLYFINYFQFEAFLQHNLERVNAAINIAAMLYGGKE